MTPEEGLTLATLGPGVTRVGNAIAADAPDRNHDVSLVAPAGTGATMRVSDQLLVRAAIPLKQQQASSGANGRPKIRPVTLTTVTDWSSIGIDATDVRRRCNGERQAIAW